MKDLSLRYDFADFCPKAAAKFFTALNGLLAEGASFLYDIHNTEYSIMFEIDCETEADAEAVRNCWGEIEF